MTEDDPDIARRMSAAYSQVGAPSPEARPRLMARLRREAIRRPSPLARFRTAMNAWSAAPVLTAATALVIGVLVGWMLRGARVPAGGVVSAPTTTARPPFAGASSTHEVRLVQFVLTAPKASRVAVVGDFNDWDPSATPLARLGGSWVAAIPVSPGRHVYAFIVDGDRWVSDPATPLAPEDDFGIRNSVIVVGGLEST
jgi:hypothetical protein